MRKSLILLFTVAAANSLPAQSLTEKIDVSLVNVDVTVTSHGAPARGLMADDFQVLEDGVPQKITHFYAIENTRDTPAVSPAPNALAIATQPDTAREAHARTGTEVSGDFVEQDSLKLRRKAAYKVVVAVHDQTTDTVGIASTILTE
jgi:hypothetical protein